MNNDNIINNIKEYLNNTLSQENIIATEVEIINNKRVDIIPDMRWGYSFKEELAINQIINVEDDLLYILVRIANYQYYMAWELERNVELGYVSFRLFRCSSYNDKGDLMTVSGLMTKIDKECNLRLFKFMLEYKNTAPDIIEQIMTFYNENIQRIKSLSEQDEDEKTEYQEKNLEQNGLDTLIREKNLDTSSNTDLEEDCAATPVSLFNK